MISTRTGVATAVGGGIALVDSGGNPVDLPAGDYGFDFNPATDRVRVTTDTGLNFRINPNTGAAVDGDPGLAGVNPDGSIPEDSAISGAAFTNNEPNANATTLYTLDSIFDRLQIQNPPNLGSQTVPVVTTVDISTVNGFDIPAGVDVTTSNSVVSSGSGLALLTVDGAIGLYSIDLVTGVATRVGNFLNGTTPASGFAIQNDLGGIPAYALSAGQLLRFNTASPGTTTPVAITGVTPGELLVGIDFRPQTGQLYALGVNASANIGTLYLVDPQTGTATAVGAAGSIAFVDGSGTLIDLPTANAYGMDFNPTVDRIRITTDTGLNFRINPNNGAPVDGDTAVPGVNPDGSISGGSTGVSANAYTNSYGQLTGGVTTLYTLDSVSNSLFIQNPPNTGTQTAQVAVKLGGSTLDFTSVNGFDIPAGVTVSTANSPATGFGFAGLTVGGVSSLYMINLVSGEATNLGAFGTGATQMVGLALADSPPAAGTATFGTAGNDILSGLDGDDYLAGLAGNDTINGAGGNDVLDGGADIDTMVGGIGNDVYGIDSLSDVIIENANEGTDAAIVFVNNYGLAAAANVENANAGLTTGQALYGSPDNNQLVGNTGDDYLAGLAGDDTIYGAGGNDVLDGGADIDTMVGGIGNDVYGIDSLSDVIIENANAGTDAAIVFVNSYTLAPNVENGSAGLTIGQTLTGNGLANLLVGNSGNDVLDGGANADTLFGWIGDDTFVFNAGQANGDIVIDFAGNGADAGDSLEFHGYGTAAQGATFTQTVAQIGTSQWTIHAFDNSVNDVITLLGATVHPNDFVFV